MAHTGKVVIKGNQKKTMKYVGLFLQRFHLLIFFVLVAGLLSATVMLINKTLTETSSQAYTSTISAGSIDESTLSRIQSFHASSSPVTTLSPQSGRANPFSE